MLILTKVKKGRKTLKFKLDADIEKKLILDEVFYKEIYFPRINRDQDFKIYEKDTVIDIGAHVGLFSVCAANLARAGRVYAFEPVQENFKRLEYHKKLNDANNLYVVNKCVSDRNKRDKIYLAKGNSGGHSMHKSKLRAINESIASVEMVDCVTLRSIFDRYKIRFCNFLKLDCEGEEWKILSKLPNSYFKRIDKIAMETHVPPVDKIKLANYLTKQGFTVTINKFGSKLPTIFAKKKVKKRK